VVPPQTAAETLATTAAAQAAQAAVAAETITTTQPFDLVFDSLAEDSAFDETVLTSTAVQGTGAYSAFIGELFSALAAQQNQATQAAEQANPASNGAAVAAVQSTPTTAQPAAAAAAATAEFASNAASLTPNSVLESNVQSLADQVTAANSGTSAATAAAADTLSPLLQSFEQFIQSAVATPSATSLPTFLQALANNLHTVPSPLGNLVDSTI